MNEKTDLRILRTQKAIQIAFLNLLKQKEFEKIAVQEICDMAMINRKTFYKYYSGKSVLAGVMISDFKQELAELAQQRQQADDLNAFFAVAVPFFYENRERILALWTIQTKRHHLYQDMFLAMQANFIKLAELKKSNHSAQDLAYQSHIFATFFLTTMKYYFEQNQPLKPKQIFEQIGQMLEIVA